VKVSFSTLLPALTKLGKYFQEGAQHYAAAQQLGHEIDVETLTAFIAGRMSGWNPKVKGHTLLDEATSRSAARFLSGVIINISKGK
jgi:hypothetical protein